MQKVLLDNLRSAKGKKELQAVEHDLWQFCSSWVMYEGDSQKLMGYLEEVAQCNPLSAWGVANGLRLYSFDMTVELICSSAPEREFWYLEDVQDGVGLFVHEIPEFYDFQKFPVIDYEAELDALAYEF